MNTWNYQAIRRPSFTLIELMIVMVIISILALAILFSLYGVAENAREARTKAQIAKVNELLMNRWESYRFRAIRLSIPSSAAANRTTRAAVRLMALRDLMRMELPERITDCNDGPKAIPVGSSGITVSIPQPAAWKMYRRRAGYVGNNTTPPSNWTTSYQGAECLYMILSGIRDGDKSGLDFFKETEFGDVDSDGMNELLDAWGNPIEFFRWAPGFSIGVGADGQWGVAGTDDNGDSINDNIEERGTSISDDQVVSDLQRPDQLESPDPFDPLNVDDDWRTFYSQPARTTFALYPLVYSAGRDGIYDLISDRTDSPSPLRYIATPLPLDPFFVIPPPSSPAGEPEKQIGMPWDTSKDGELNHLDNITNHLLDV